MDWAGWTERFGEPAVLAVCGLLAGLGFGVPPSDRAFACAWR
jgi:hypothetical protein